MTAEAVPGYMGRVLRVDLAQNRLSDEALDVATLRTWVGGTGLGAKYLYDEVPPGVAWDASENRLMVFSGPLGGTTFMGTGTISIVTKGPMTNGATSSQANGFMGAFMKFAGYDGLVIQGQSLEWVYLYLHGGQAELRPAGHLLGLDTYEVHHRIAEELGKSQRAISVFSVGPAGENQVRFAAIVGDHGHVAGHNGTGAVMGSKRLKAIVAERGGKVMLAEPGRASAFRDEIIESIKADPMGATSFKWGTSHLFAGLSKRGLMPIKNFQTNLFEPVEPFLGETYRKEFKLKRSPCWACQTHHLHEITITSGPYAGFVGEEPEYEQWDAWGPLTGNKDVAAAFVLSNTVDLLGLENNEAGWVVGWAMEAYEKGVLTREDLNGLDLTWGNVEAVRALLEDIAHRRGIGGLLAEGVKRAAEKWGRNSDQFAIFTGKGNSPRSIDHRAAWAELLDTSLSSTGTLEVGMVSFPEELGIRANPHGFDGKEVGEMVGRYNGRQAFVDSLGICQMCLRVKLSMVAEAVNIVTGWDLTLDECMTTGRRINNLLRCFNLRHGIGPELEFPSPRYGSTPVDGPAQGKSSAEHWHAMRRRYYELMGWDLESGKPLASTLRSLGLDFVLPDLWPNENVP